MSMQVEDHVWIFKVPSQQSLGDSERDYSNVEVQLYEVKKEAITVVAKQAEAADARQKLDVKRKRSEEQLIDANERQKLVESKLATAEMEHRVWKTVWSHVARGEDHISRAEGQTWKDYFLEKTGNEQIIQDSCPPSMCVADLPFEDMLMQLAKYVGSLNDNGKKLQASLAKATTNIQRLEKAGEKQQQLAHKRIEKLSDPNAAARSRTLAILPTSCLMPNMATI